MTNAFDHAAWLRTLQQPDWYITLYPELKELMRQWHEHPETARSQRIREEVYSFFESALEHNHVNVAKTGQNLDAERQPVDTIVIHHTGREPSFRLSRLNAVQLLRVYVPYFNNPTIPGEERLKGQPIWSNHVQEGRVVFYSYHWLLRLNGRAERLLQDDQIGWHAGNWPVNCRSVAICLDNNYTHEDPAPATLRHLAVFIKKQYPNVKPERIFGHREVSQKPTICPGTHFVTWKPALLKLLATN